MNFDEYQLAAQRTSNNTTKSSKIENGILGLCGESGEVADIMKKYLYQGHEFDRDHMVEEIGDVLWYVAELAAGLGVSMDEIAQKNINKLWKRYPTGFDSFRSTHREEDEK